MLRTAKRIVLAVLALAFASSTAMAGKRVALVIGNSAYTNAPTLTNPKNDAQDMAAALKALGFTVILGSDLDKSGMDRKILEFEKALSGAEAGVFHYSGHGLQVAGVNYLVPVDANLESAAALRIEAVRLDFIQETMEREAKTNILFLDACRNNPLTRNLARALGTRSAEIGRGLASMESGAGTLISFSTQPGNVALDGAGRNSPYSGPLVKAIGAPGEDVLLMLTGVRNAVMAATAEKQVPWDNNALRAKFYFNPGSAPGVPTAPLSADAQAWSLVQNSQSEAVLEEFVRRFPDSVYAGFAKARLEELKPGKAASWWPWSSGKPAEAEKPQVTQAGAPETKPAQVALAAPPTPAPAIPAAPACDGLLVAVAQSNTRPCIKPGLGESFKDCPDCPEMVVAPAGSFMMGSTAAEVDAFVQEYGKDKAQLSFWETPQHVVRIPKPYAIGRFAITRAQFAKFLKATGHKTEDGCYSWSGSVGADEKSASWRSPGFEQGDDHPVVCVNWNDASAYADWLARTTGLPYRLLSEAEAEYAARAGTGTPFWWGKSISTAQANYGKYTSAGSAKAEYRQKTLPVKSFRPNPWGLYQVHGNVWTWTEDCWNDTYAEAPTDGSAKITGICSMRVLRGGSWDFFSGGLRAVYRNRNVISARLNNIGFRVARTLD